MSSPIPKQDTVDLLLPQTTIHNTTTEKHENVPTIISSPPTAIDAAKLLQHSPSIAAVADILEEAAPTKTCSNIAPVSPFASSYTNACARARILFATDEWFASAENLLQESPPHFDPLAYCEQGKVMDGWETRRRRDAGYDFCIIRLPERFAIYAVELDTAHFTGNHTPAVSLHMADIDTQSELSMVQKLPYAMERLLKGGGVQGTGVEPVYVEQAEEALTTVGSWTTLLSTTSLRPGYEDTRMHYFVMDQTVTGTHVRLNYYPDGGVARLKLWGQVVDSTCSIQQPHPRKGVLPMPTTTGPWCTVVSHSSSEELPSQSSDCVYPELSSSDFGGVGVACSNQHYGNPWNLIQPTTGRDMGDGWETARHPDRPRVWIKDEESGLLDTPLMDWCILKLGAVTTQAARIILDTKHFRGNYPESVLVEGCFVQSDDDLLCDQDANVEWFTLIPRSRMAPDSEHVFLQHQINNPCRKVSHVRVSIFPDGGLSRVRVYGSMETPQ